MSVPSRPVPSHFFPDSVHLLPNPPSPTLQSPGHHLPVVPEPAESHPLPGVQPLQVADHQDRAGPAAAHHAGPLPLQHAWLPRQEAARSLRGLPAGVSGESGWRGWPAGCIFGWVDGCVFRWMDKCLDGWMDA